MQFAVVKGRARAIPPLVIVAWTQAVACAAWVVFFAVSGHAFVPPGAAWPAIAASSLLVIGMSGLLARASARGDISIVGPILALSPIFTILPDAALSGGWPSPLGWIGLALSLTGTVSLSGGPGAVGLLGRVRVLFARRDALDALGAAFFLGFLAAVDRWAALAIGPPSYLVSSHGATAAVTTLIALLTNPRGLAASCRAAQPGHPGEPRPARRHRHRDADARAHYGARRLRERDPPDVGGARRPPRRLPPS